MLLAIFGLNNTNALNFLVDTWKIHGVIYYVVTFVQLSKMLP